MNNWQSISVKISYSDFSSICRICFAKNNLRALQEEECLSLNDILQNLTNTKITFNDGLPQSICVGCIKKLKDISDFISLSLKLNSTSVCRICLAKDNLKAIKEVEYLIDVLRSLTDTKIAFDDDLPQNICLECIKKLEDISDFIDLSVYNISCLKNVYLTRNDIKTNTVNWISNSGTDNDFSKISENDGFFTDVTQAANKNDEVQGSDHGGSDSEDSDFFYKDTASTSIQETSEVVNKSDKVQNSDAEDSNFFYPDTSDSNETSQKDKSSVKSQETRTTKRTPNYSYKFYQSKERNRENQKKHRRKMIQENDKLLETLTGVEKKNASLKEQIKDLREQKHQLGLAILVLLKECSA